MSETRTVSEVNKQVAELVKRETSLSGISVSGEISNFTNHIKTGHLYFTLKDEKTSIRGIMFRGNAERLRFEPQNGMKVTVDCDVRVFERDGLFQLYVSDMRRDGLGGLHTAFLELKERLAKEGLFAQNRPLPPNPAKIAVITSETGAALQDILNILSRRNPLVKVVLIPALVQGASAPQSLIAGFEKAQSSGADVIIFGRGGGSIEDLWAFNDEGLARVIYKSKIPTVSAVGHEIDFTIGDFVADLRAPTPSAAAELCVRDIGEVYDWVVGQKALLRQRLVRLVAFNSERVDAFAREITAKSPAAKLNNVRTRLDGLESRVRAAVNGRLAVKKQQLIAEMKRIDALSPLNVLMRGYSIVTDSENRAVSDASEVKVGDTVKVRLHKGSIAAKVVKTET